MIACITDELAIRRILAHLGLGPPEQRRDVPVDDQCRGLPAMLAAGLTRRSRAQKQAIEGPDRGPFRQ